MAEEGIGKLVAYLGVDTAALEAGHSRAEKSLKDLDDRMSVTAASAGKLSGAMIGAFVAAASVMVHRTVEAMDAQRDLAQSLGISVESFQELIFIGRQAGLSQEDLSGVINKLNRNIQAAASGQQEQSQAFKDLGVSATDAQGNLRSADQVLMDVADRFQKIPDGAGKSAIAMDLFGKSGAKLIPLLNDGSTGLRQQIELAHQLGFVFSSETAAAADHFNDTLDVLQMAGTGFANRLTAELLPTLTNVGDTMLDVAKDSGTMETASSALSTMLKGLVTVGLYVASTFSDIGGWIGAVVAAAATAARGDFTGAMNIIRERSDDSAASMEKLEARVKKVWSNTTADANNSASKQMIALKRMTEAEKEHAKEVEEAAKRKQKAHAETVKALQEEAATLGMTAGQAAVYKLQMDGATEAQIRAAEAARRVIDAFAAQKELGQIKIGAMDGNDAALAELQEKYKHLNEIIAANPQLQQQAAEAAAMLAQQYQNSVDAQILAGQQNDQAFRDSMAQRIEMIKAQNAAEMEIEIKKYQDDQEMLEQAMLNGVITEQQYRDISAENEKAHEDKMRKMKIKSWDDLKNVFSLNWKAQVDILSGSLAEMTSALATKNRAMFEINKAAALANIGIHTYEGAIGAYKAMASIPYVGPALGVAAAAGVLAFGGAQADAVMSTQFGGGAKSTSAGIPSAATSAPADAGAGAGGGQQHRLAIEGISEDQLYSGKSIRGLVEKLKDYQKDGGTLVIT